MSHLRKLQRAEFHLERLEQSVKRWAQSEPYSFPYELEPETREYVIRLKVARPFPEEWSVEAGDILFNLRSALDHLAFALCTKGKGSVLTEKESKGCQFPVFGGKRPDAGQWKQMIGLAGKQVGDAIERLQPYNTPDYRCNPLWVLHILNNIDKHRCLHVAAVQIYGFTAQRLVNLRPKSVIAPETALQDGYELARFDVIDLNPETRTAIYCNLPMLESFDCGMPEGQVFPVDQGLRRTLNYLRTDILPPLDKFL